jgi:hypothetical protein
MAENRDWTFATSVPWAWRVEICFWPRASMPWMIEDVSTPLARPVKLSAPLAAALVVEEVEPTEATEIVLACGTGIAEETHAGRGTECDPFHALFRRGG